MRCKNVKKEIKWYHNGVYSVVTPRDIKTFVSSVVNEHYDPVNKTLSLFKMLESPQVYNEYDWDLRPVIKDHRLIRDNPQMTVDESLFCVFKDTNFDKPVALEALYTYLVFMCTLCIGLIKRGEKEWAQRLASKVIVTCPCCVPAIINRHHRHLCVKMREMCKNLTLESQCVRTLRYLKSCMTHIIGFGVVLGLA